MNLWQHQRDAVAFLERHKAAMLAMDMGTGKSRCIVETVRGLLPGSNVLIVCPKSVLTVWAPEFEKFAGDEDIDVVTLTKGSATVKAKTVREAITRSRGETKRVVVVNYETAARKPMMEVWREFAPWDLVVLDESHRIKAARGSTSRALASLRAVRKACLTGTPMPHSPLDMFGQARFLDPNIFGTIYTRFRNRYAVMGGYRVNGRPVQVLGYQNMAEFQRKLAGFVFQVKADDVLDLPEHQHIVRECPMPPKAERDYRSLERDFVIWLESGEAVTATNVLDKLGKLMQFTGGHVRYENEFAEKEVVAVHTAKQDALQDILEDLPPEEPVVVFCTFWPDLDAVARAAEKAGRRCLELSGRRNDLAEWQGARGGEVLAVQIQAGGVGISLVRARYCCYYSTGFSLGNYEQSLARVRRPGQTRRVVYYHLTVPGSVDQKVYKALSDRKDVVQEVMTNVASFTTR